jgi:hypothetical protein
MSASGHGSGGEGEGYAPRARTSKNPRDSPSDWVRCANATRQFDLEMVGSLRGDMDTLLVFVRSEIIGLSLDQLYSRRLSFLLWSLPS